MWPRNLLFAVVCGLGFATLGAYLLAGRPNIHPLSFQPERMQQADFRNTVDDVNRQFRADWSMAGLEPAGRADDLAICRRLSLALTGTIPSLEEIRAIEAQPAEYRVQWWVSRLVEDRRYCDYVAERFARVFVGTDNGPFLVYRRRRFVVWLADQLEAKVPYDALARKLISDRGLWTDSPAVNFVTVTLDQNGDKQPDPIRLARRVSRAFLGVRLDCVQCHDDNLGGDWLQTDFHQLAAFFSDARQTAIGVRDEDHDYKYQYLDADSEQIVESKVPFRDEAFDETGTRRQQLARWVTHRDNPAFARTTVNRVWALLFGNSMFEAVDNIPLDGPFPPGLETLAKDFAEHGHDLRRLIRLIAGTEAFQRDSRAEHEITARHEAQWAAFPLTRLRPEQISGSILQSASLQTIDAESHILVRLVRSQQQSEFVRRYGDTGEDEFGAHGGTIPQRLLMLNGNMVKERTKEDLVGNASTRIATFASDDATAITTAYLAVLTRVPSMEEMEHFTELLEGKKKGQRARICEDLYWTLLNSSEFSWNH